MRLLATLSVVAVSVPAQEPSGEQSQRKFQRLGEGPSPVQTQAPTNAPEADLASERLQRWQKRVSEDDEEEWMLRLSLDRLDPQRARRAMDPVQWSDQSELPTWATILEEVIQVAGTVPTDELRKRLFAAPKEEHDLSLIHI